MKKKLVTTKDARNKWALLVWQKGRKYLFPVGKFRDACFLFHQNLSLKDIKDFLTNK